MSIAYSVRVRRAAFPDNRSRQRDDGEYMRSKKTVSNKTKEAGNSSKVFHKGFKIFTRRGRDPAQSNVRLSLGTSGIAHPRKQRVNEEVRGEREGRPGKAFQHTHCHSIMNSQGIYCTMHCRDDGESATGLHCHYRSFIRYVLFLCVSPSSKARPVGDNYVF